MLEDCLVVFSSEELKTHGLEHSVGQMKDDLGHFSEVNISLKLPTLPIVKTDGLLRGSERDI